MDRKAVRNALHRGTLDNVGLGRGTPITIRGIEFKSLKEAADFFGRSDRTLKKMIAEGREQKFGLGTPRPNNRFTNGYNHVNR